MRVALVVGIGQYDSRIAGYPSLRYCVPSARKVFDLIVAPKFGGCEPHRSKLLVDDNGSAITPDRLVRSMEEILLSMKSDDTFLFYFCGHGDRSGSNLFLMTTGAKQAQDGYGFGSLLSRLGQRDVRNVLLIVDACFSRAMFDSVKYWGQERMPDNFGQIASAGYTQNAWEVDELKQTLFSHYFCKGIQTGCPGYGSNNKSLITIDVMTEYINDQLASNHTEYAQRAVRFSMGDPEKLWIARRPDRACTANPQKPIYSFSKAIETFRKDYILPMESDRVVEYMMLLRRHLNIPPEKIHLRNKIEENIDRLIPLILNYRKADWTKSSEARQQKASICVELEVLYRDLEASKD